MHNDNLTLIAISDLHDRSKVIYSGFHDLVERAMNGPEFDEKKAAYCLTKILRENAEFKNEQFEGSSSGSKA